ncbi:MAG: hypothetical protein WD073_02600 [Xanthobacteraceae bacterium]
MRNEDVIRLAGIDESDFKAICDSELAEIERRRQRYLGTRERNPKKLVLAVPVAPTDSLAVMREEADDVVCLEDHEFFGVIGIYYSDFRQVSDEEVIEMLRRFPLRKPEGTRQPAA